MRFLSLPIITLAVVASAGCKGKTSEPTEIASAARTGSADAGVTAAVPVDRAQPTLAALPFDATQIGSLSNMTKLDMTELQKLFPDAVIERRTEQVEGQPREYFIVKMAGTPVLEVTPALGWVHVLDPSLKDRKGIGLGSSYEALASAYNDVACEWNHDKGEKPGPVNAVTCRTPVMNGVSYTFNLAGANKPNAEAAQAAAGAKISAISIMFGASPTAAQRVTAPSATPTTTAPQVVRVFPVLGAAEATACRGEDVTFLLPSQRDGDWKVTKLGKGLEAPKREFAEKFLGPNGHAEKLTWKTKHLDSKTATAVIKLTNRADNLEVVATIHLTCGK